MLHKMVAFLLSSLFEFSLSLSCLSLSEFSLSLCLSFCLWGSMQHVRKPHVVRNYGQPVGIERNLPPVEKTGKNLKLLIWQPQGTECCQTLHKWGSDSFSSRASGWETSPHWHLDCISSGDPDKPSLDSWPRETVRRHMCCFKPLSSW